jgi:uncharacterized membrane protein HdeD (DUF308 family)
MSNEEAEKSFWVTIITSVLFIVFGIYLLYQPNTTILIIARCLTIITLLVSLFGAFKYFTRKDKTKKVDVNLIYGIIALIATIVLFFSPYIISDIVPLAIGIIMIVGLLLKLGYLKQVKQNQVKDFGTCLLIFILMLILSLLIVFNPMKAVLNINQSMGMIIIFYSILDVIMCYLFRNNIN